VKVAIKTDLGETIATVALQPKVFSTGSRGEYKAFKIEVDGRRYQMTVTAVEIGSKNSGGK